MPVSPKVVAPLVAVVVLAGGYGVYRWIARVPPPPPPPPPVGEVVQSMDALQAQLAERSRQHIGDAKDFQIIVTEAAYPVGTLMRQGRTIPVSYTACPPAGAPPRVPTPSLFPSYSLSREAALGFGLDEGVVEGLGKAGVKLKSKSGVTLGFRDTALQVLSDADLKAMLIAPGCAQALQGGPFWLVRGYVQGQRRFRLDSESSGGATLAVTKIADFDVSSDAGGGSVEVSDDAAVGFLQIVSEVAAAPAPAAAATTGPPPPGPPPNVPATDAPNLGGSPATLPTPAAKPSATPTMNPGVFRPGKTVDLRQAAYHPKPIAVAQGRLGPLLVSVGKPSAMAHPAAAARGRVYLQRDRADASGAAAAVQAALSASGLNVEPQVEAIDSGRMPRVAQVRYFNAADLDAANGALARLRASFPNATLVHVSLPAPSGQLEVWLPRAG